MKKGKTLFDIIILSLCVGALGFAFYFGWKFYQEKYKKIPTKKLIEEKMALLEVKPEEQEAVLFSEFSDTKDIHVWNNSNVINLANQKIYTIPLPKNTFSFVYPEISGGRIYYYTTESNPADYKAQSLTLWSSDLFGENEKKIVTATDEFYPRSIFISPNGKYLVYFRTLKKDPQKISIWVYEIDQEVSRELVPFSKNIYFEGSIRWAADSSKFYFFKKEKGKLRLFEARIEKSEVLQAFPKVDFKKINFENILKPVDSRFFIDPEGAFFYYLIQAEKKDSKIKSQIVRIDTATGEKKELFSSEGKIAKIALSADGKKIVFRVTGKKGIQELFIMESDGENLKKILDAKDEKEVLSDVMFAYDSKNLLLVRKIYHEYTKIVLVNPDDLQEKELLLHRVTSLKKSSYLRLQSVVRVPVGLKWKEYKEGLRVTLKKAIEKEEKEKGKGEILRDEIMNFVEKNIENITPYIPSPEAAWRILRFAFVSDESAYVEYEDGHIVSRLLLRCIKLEGDIKCENVGLFEAENFAWKLVSGEDPFSEKVTQYYEKRQGAWRKTYRSDEVTYFPVGQDVLIGIQESVDAGHNQWRKDPLEVVKSDVPDAFGFNPAKDKYKLILRDEKTGRSQVEIIHGQEIYEVVLKQPVKKGKAGIWIISQIIKLTPNKK